MQQFGRKARIKDERMWKWSRVEIWRRSDGWGEPVVEEVVVWCEEVCFRMT